MRTVICPTDASLLATNAVNYAKQFCKTMCSPLVLFEQNSIKNLFTTPKQLTEDNSLEISTFGSHTIQTVSGKETLADPALRFQSILSVAQAAVSEGAELIITGVEKDFCYQDISGQAIIELTKNARCPVLLIPESVAFNPIQRILLVIDHEFNIAPRMEFIADIARSFGAEIYLFQINKEREIAKDHPFYRSSLDFYLTFNYDSVYFLEAVNESVPDAIRKFTTKTNADLVIIVPDMEEHLPCSSAYGAHQLEAVAKPLSVPVLAIDAEAIQAEKPKGYPFD
jgi:hypothetical protein